MHTNPVFPSRVSGNATCISTIQQVMKTLLHVYTHQPHYTNHRRQSWKIIMKDKLPSVHTKHMERGTFPPKTYVGGFGVPQLTKKTEKMPSHHPYGEALDVPLMVSSCCICDGLKSMIWWWITVDAVEIKVGSRSLIRGPNMRKARKREIFELS